MKVRLTPNSVRYRLDQEDTEILADTSSVDFCLPLGSDREIRCALEVSESAPAIGVTSQQGEIVVTLPAEQAHEWLSTDDIGLEEHVEVDGQRVQVLVEKDLGCRHGKNGSDASPDPDTFDHLRD